MNLPVYTKSHTKARITFLGCLLNAGVKKNRGKRYKSGGQNANQASLWVAQ